MDSNVDKMDNCVELLSSPRCSTKEEAEKRLSDWKNLFSPTYGWINRESGIIDHEDGTFSAYLKHEKIG